MAPAVVQAMRLLWGNDIPVAGSAWPLRHAVPVTIGWSILLVAIFAPLAIRAYRRRTTD